MSVYIVDPKYLNVFYRSHYFESHKANNWVSGSDKLMVMSLQQHGARVLPSIPPQETQNSSAYGRWTGDLSKWEEGASVVYTYEWSGQTGGVGAPWCQLPWILTSVTRLRPEITGRHGWRASLCWKIADANFHVPHICSYTFHKHSHVLSHSLWLTHTINTRSFRMVSLFLHLMTRACQEIETKSNLALLSIQPLHCQGTHSAGSHYTR